MNSVLRWITFFLSRFNGFGSDIQEIDFSTFRYEVVSPLLKRLGFVKTP